MHNIRFANSAGSFQKNRVTPKRYKWYNHSGKRSIRADCSFPESGKKRVPDRFRTGSGSDDRERRKQCDRF